jgi:hypothetical protein
MTVEFPVSLIEKEVGKKQNVFLPVLQSRHTEGKFIDSVIQVFSEISFGDGFFQILIRGADKAYVDLNLFG